MSHAVVIVVVPGDTPKDEIEDALALVLAPYYEYRDVEDGYNTENAKWDWYVIGGRWAQAIMNTTRTEHHEDERFGDYDTHHGGSDVLRKGELLSCQTPLAFVDRDGEWHERGQLGWWGHIDSPKEPDEWESTFNVLLTKVDSNDWLVAVDYHI